MDDQVDRLVTKVWDRFQKLAPDQRLLIAIGGIPGSGKTTLSHLVTSRINALASPTASQPVAAFVPMDGYHLTRAQLSALPNPTEAHARRGAAFTFDGAAFHSLVQSARAPLLPTTGTIYAPSFDHAIKDPKENDIPIAPTHKVLVFEGNYVALDKEPWRDAAALMDELWFVDVNFDVARQRLIKRHVAAGIAENDEEAEKRANENDLVNGQEIVDHRLEVHELIVSREDGTWVRD